MNKKKILAAALCGTMLFSLSSVPAAAEGVSGYKTGKEKVLTDILDKVSEQTEEHVRKMSSLVKAAVQIAKAEEEAQKAAEKAAEEARKKQEEADKKAKEEKAAADAAAANADNGYGPKPVSFTPDNYEPYVETLYADKVTVQETNTADTAAEAADTVSSDAVYTEPLYTYNAAAYAAPVYAEPVYTDPVYVEPVYTEPVYTEPVYEEPVYEEPVYEEPVYEDAYADDSLNTGYEEAAVSDDAAYLDNTYTEDFYGTESYAEDTGSDGVRATASDSDLDLLASIIYCEAGGESYEGQVAVGAVVLNRMESELYPDDMSDVIYQSGQFTPAMTGWLDQVRSSGVPDYCYDAAQAALNGENPVGDCLYFHAGGGDGLTIGNQTFY